MSIKQKLQNPFALVAQGFVAGAVLLWATSPSDAQNAPSPQPMVSAAGDAGAEA
jgi:hypothetical protein